MQHPSLFLLLVGCANAGATLGLDAPKSNVADNMFVVVNAALYGIANPALPRRFSTDDSRFRFNVAASAGYELGQVDHFINGIDNLQSELNENTRRLSLASYIKKYGLDAKAIENAVVADLNSKAIAVINRQIALITADSSYVLAHGSLGEPVQVMQNAWGGQLIFGSRLSAASNLLAVGDPLKPYTLSELEQKIIQALTSAQPSVNYLLPDTDTAVLVRSAIVDELSLAYSRAVLDDATGQMFAGLRAHYYQVKLSRYAKRLRDYGSTESSKDLLDHYSDNDASYSRDVGVDLGVSWVTRRYRLGAVLNNINQPEFQYNAVKTSDYTGTAVPQRLNADRTWKMNTQLRIEAAAHSRDEQWSLGTSADTTSVEDPLGHDYQWVSAGTAYTPRTGWIPGLRAAYQANMRGSRLRYVTTGLTLFNMLSLDMTRSIDTVYLEENDAVAMHGRYPRSVIYNFLFEIVI